MRVRRSGITTLTTRASTEYGIPLQTLTPAGAPAFRPETFPAWTVSPTWPVFLAQPIVSSRGLLFLAWPIVPRLAYCFQPLPVVSNPGLCFQPGPHEIFFFLPALLARIACMQGVLWRVTCAD